MPKSIYYRSPYQQILSKEIKGKFEIAMNTLIDGDKNGLDKARAIYSLSRLFPIIDSLPDPDENNVGSDPVAIQLVRIKDKFFRCLKLPTRSRILRVIIKFAFIIYVTDFYRPFMKWWLLEIKNMEIGPMGPMQPDPHYWEEETQ